MSPTVNIDSTPTVSPSQFPRLVTALREFFTSRDIVAYLVGGIVRDAVMGRASRDIDLAVAGEPRLVGDGLAKLFRGRCVVLDDARGMVRVVASERGSGPYVDVSPLRESIKGDLARRDFTVDAMAVPLAELAAESGRARLIDPHQGMRDIHDRVIREVSPSVFEADPARLMRGPRLAAQLRFTLSPDTAGTIRRGAHLLAAVAPERVRDEFLLLLAEPGARRALRALDDLGLLGLLFPELSQARGVTQPKEHHWDVFDHCIETAGQVEVLLQESGPEIAGDVSDGIGSFPSVRQYFAEEVSDGHTRLTLLKLAGLLHDVAKPVTKTVEGSGRIRFLGHQSQGAQMAKGMLGRLRFSRRGIEMVCRMVAHHLRPSQMAQQGDLPTRRALYRYYRELGDEAVDTLYLNMADYLAARGPGLSGPEWRAHCRLIGHILDYRAEPQVKGAATRLIDGHEIMRTFCLPPGPRLGVLLELVREAQANGEISTKEEAMHLVNSSLGTGADRA